MSVPKGYKFGKRKLPPPFSEGHRKNLSLAGKGRKFSIETIQKIKETKIKNGSYKLSEETKKKIGLAFEGRKLSEDHKRHIRESLKNLTEEKRLKHRLVMGSEEMRKKMSEARKGKSPWNKGIKTGQKVWNKGLKGFLGGEKHYNWKGGISFNPYSENWTRSLKQQIRERDNHACQICLGKGKDVHHIDYNKKNCSEDNLITLCRKCHMKTNFGRQKWLQYFNMNYCLS